jgi:hypothetical protein
MAKVMPEGGHEEFDGVGDTFDDDDMISRSDILNES